MEMTNIIPGSSRAYRASLAEFSDLLESSRFLSRDHNPVIVFLRDQQAPLEVIRHAIEQYSFLPATIVEYLTLGGESVSSWPVAATELQRNRGEEMGSRTSGTSHYEILRERLLAELQIDLTLAKPTASTASFLETLRRNLNGATPEFGAGIVYALESSAVLELLVVAELLNEYARAADLPKICDISKIMSGALHGNSNGNFDPNGLSLSEFIAIHVADFEVGHEANLADAFELYLISDGTVSEFKVAFNLVLDAMNTWWADMSDELKLCVGTHHNHQVCDQALASV